MENVNLRLEVLKYILENSSLSLDKTQGEVIWDALFEKAVCKDEKEVTCVWFRNCVENSKKKLFESNNVSKHLFISKISKMSVTSLDGFLCVKSFFIACNSCLGLLRSKGNSDEEIYILQSPDNLIGKSFMWSIALSDVKEVTDTAVSLLNSLYRNIDTSSGLDIVNVRKSYLDACLIELEKALSEAADISNPNSVSKRAERCISLINSFINESERNEGTGGLRPHAASLKGFYSFRSLLSQSLLISLSSFSFLTFYIYLSLSLLFPSHAL